MVNDWNKLCASCKGNQLRRFVDVRIEASLGGVRSGSGNLINFPEAL